MYLSQLNVKHEDREWGSFDTLVLNSPCTVKILYVRANSRLSLQYHKKRTEHWQVIYGQCTVQIGDDVRTLYTGERAVVPAGVKHRIITNHSQIAQILEISFGEFDENDIVRLQDDYGRV